MSYKTRDFTRMATRDACALKWGEGRIGRGSEFEGDPVLELDGEIIDAINYAEQADLDDLARDLELIRERVVTVAKANHAARHAA